MKKNLINEHDYTKKMLDAIRGDSSRVIKEALETTNSENHEDGGDVITPNSSDSNYSDEVKKFSDTVDPRVQITKFKIYPKDRDVQFEGRLDSGINFYMSIREMKLSISITDEDGKAIKIYVDSDLIATIQKLSGYYENWSKEWAQKLTTEYKAQ